MVFIGESSPFMAIIQVGELIVLIYPYILGVLIPIEYGAEYEIRQLVRDEQKEGGANQAMLGRLNKHLGFFC